MFGGSIYIDPDSVSSVSSQIGITAEQLDSLRRSIVPQVNEVIMMSYPSIQEMPNVAYPLDSTQGNIEAFNYRAQLLAEDLRTTSLKLNQVAEAGRTMNEILLRQTTMFGVTGAAGGQGGLSGNGLNSSPNAKIPDWLQQLVDASGITFGAATGLIGILKQIDAFSNNETFQQLADGITGLDEMGVGDKLDALSFYIKVLNGSHDAKTLTSEFVGENISNAVKLIAEDNPYVAGVMAAFTIVNVAGAGMGSFQGWFASRYSGNPTIQSSLKATANGLTEASKNADPGKVFDDIGGTAFDMGALLLGHGSLSSVIKDEAGMYKDTANTLYSIPQFVANGDLMIAQDTSLGLNALVQNSPLPASWKSVYQTNTYNDINTWGQYAKDVNKVPAEIGKFTDKAQNILITGSQQFYNQEVVVQ